MVDIEKSGPGVDERALASFEAQRGGIPATYRKFLLRSNGGRPSPARFRCRTAGQEILASVDEFLGFDGEWSDLSRVLDIYDARIPVDLFPIATTPADDLVLIGRDDSPRAGKVFYWFHEEEAPDGEEPDDRNIYPIADSLDAFLGSLADE